ncbi:MAG TPA: PAS domain S-box protein [Chloroflexi bacterium]|nr:PAS domain S-box protein [Chloroflexota bacterium]
MSQQQIKRDADKTKEELIEELAALRRKVKRLADLEIENKRAAQALQESQIRFAGILDITSNAIIATDERQRIILFNKGAEEIFGYSSAEAMGQPLDILIPRNVITVHRQHINRFADAEAFARLMDERQGVSGRRKNGEEFPAEASIAKLDTGGERIFTVVLRDITERKRIEQEKEKLIEQLRALNKAAQAIASELSLDQVLQTIVEAARSLLKVKYAALRLHNEQKRFITTGIDQKTYGKIKTLPVGRGLLNPLLHQRQTLIVNDIAGHLQSVGFPEHHPAMRSLLGVPIRSKGKLIGALYLSDKEDGSNFAPADKQLVEMLALHATIAIENAHHHEQTQRLAILEERERFARDLHDGIIQSIYAVGLALDQAKADILPSSQTTREQIDLSLKNLAAVIQDIRNYIFDLRPQATKHRGLKARLDGLIKEVKVNTLLPIESDIAPDINAELSDWQASHVFHICHESLSNAIRHAKPSRIAINLSKDGDAVTLIVADNGTGFDLPPEIHPGHRGLSNIRTRVSQLGGSLNIDTAPQQGTRVTLRFRCDAPEKIRD